MNKKIPDSELEILRTLWREQRPVKSVELCDEFQQTKGWSRSTTNTLIGRLRYKDLIEPANRYGAARFVPLITEEEYILAEEAKLLKRFGSAKKLIAAMLRNNNLTDADLDELREYLNGAGGNENPTPQ